jgi:hypothetical protein
MHLKKNIPNDPSNMMGGEEKETKQGYSLSKFEYDLYHEEEDKAFPVVRVKRVALPNKGERWRIFHDAKLVMTLEGTKLTKKERMFLRGVDGVNLLLKKFKNAAIPSFHAIKKEIRANLK